jgi:alkylation response protein AidB-like acyl-CoA dehydrogenase
MFGDSLRPGPAATLDRFLGDPDDSAGLFSYARAMECDEAERFPSEAADALGAWGLYEYFVPGALGGKLPPFDEALSMMRVLSRRDPTLAIAFGQCFLGAMPVWISGSAELQRRAASVLAAGRSMALALTERAHGGDLAATEVSAHPEPGCYRLTGEKWLINNATRGAALTVLARTDSSGGPRALSLFFFEKDRTEHGTFLHLPKIRTHGIRAADISGVRFEGARVDAQGLVGPLGDGIETTLKALMVTRALCPAFSLGAADSALRLTVRFARSRRLYGATVWDIPASRAALIGAFVDLRVCETLAFATARALHVVPEQASIWSAVAKYYVPTAIEATMNALGVVLGARYYLREEFASGVFQKLLRDAMVVGLFDGSTPVNLHAIGLQLHALSTMRPRTEVDPKRNARLDALVDAEVPLPPPEFARLSLIARGRNDAVQALESAVEWTPPTPCDPDVRAFIQGAMRRLLAVLKRDEEAIAALPRAAGRGSAELFALSSRYCAIHAAAVCAHAWLRSGRGGECTALGLERVCKAIDPALPAPPPTFAEAVVEQLLAHTGCA